MSDDVASLTLSNRVVLLGLASLETDGETPTHAPRVRTACRDRVAPHAEAVVGTLDEATVARSLNELDADGYVEQVPTGEPSTVGKGRPAFTLASSVDALLSAFDADDALADAAAAVQDGT